MTVFDSLFFQMIASASPYMYKVCFHKHFWKKYLLCHIVFSLRNEMFEMFYVFQITFKVIMWYL